MPRLLFEKTGNAIWISHLDLMRVFQRAFKRAGLPLTHTQGFNPRPSVSIALPLSVGIESACELLDFDLDGNFSMDMESIGDPLNRALIDGVRVLAVYENGQKIKNLAYLDCRLEMEYDSDLPQAELVQALFERDEVLVEKKSKNGTSEQNIIPMIRALKVQQQNDHTLVLSARICCQNPTLNPMQLAAAVARYLPGQAPGFVVCKREEIYDCQEKIFR